MMREASAYKNYCRPLFAGVALMSFLGAGHCFAQEQATPEETEDIIVTATKRGDQRLQDIPQAISAFGGDQLEALQIRNVEDLSFKMPNVSLQTVGSIPYLANFSIRGQGINSSIPTVEPTVGVFADGVYLGTTFGVVTNAFDLESVEVLRGPQGVLFGRNVSGGAVLLRSRRPVIGDPVKVRGRIGVETGPQYMADLAIDVPLGSRAAGKFAVQYSNDRGWFRNRFDGSKLGKSESLVLRTALAYEPVDTLKIELLAEHGDVSGDGAVNQNPSVLSGFAVDIDERGFSKLKWTQATVETNLDVNFGDGVITNIAAWRRMQNSTLADIDGLPVLGLNGLFRTEAEQWSNELRYAGTFGDFWDITAGVFYFGQDLEYRERRVLRGGIDATLGGDQKSSTWAVFAQNDLRVSNALTVNLGLRYAVEKKDAQVANFAVASNCDPLGNGFGDVACRFNFTDDVKFSGFTPKIGVQYKPTADAQLYGFWTRGFRSGGYNVRNSSAPQSAGPTSDEKMDSFEVGAKTAWADGRIILNGALFYNDIRDLQRETVFADPVSGVIQALRNTADGRIVGGEIDGTLRVSDRFSISYSLGYQHGKYTRVFFDLNRDGTIDAVDKGLKLPRLASWSGSVSAVYTVPLSDLGDLAFTADYSYKDRSPFDDANTAFLSKAHLVNASIRLTAPDERFHLAIYGRNLLNEDYEGATLPSLFGGFRYLNEGRVFGVSAGFRI
jgi:iron complex outermembrane recepter protein